MTRMSSRSETLFVELFILVLALASFGYGQAISGELTGTVVDPSGAAVTGAAIEAVNVATGQKIATTTKSNGEYRFSELPIGSYNLTVSAPNFSTVTVRNVPVELNKVGTSNITLQVGSSSTTVEVSGVAPPVDTSTAQLQSNYGEQFSQDLGITSAGGLGAGVLNLSLLSPGVTQASSMGDGVGPSVGGQRPRANNFTVEGVDNNNKVTTGALITVPNDAVESFTLLENQFNSEFGHSSGGQFNTTIKRGTNEFHGSVYEYFRNRNLNAVDNFYVLAQQTKNPRFDSNRYGATFGGPIIKNKLFFFTDYERQPVGLTGTAGGAVFTPTQAGLAAIDTDPSISATNFNVFKQYVPVAPAPTSPATCMPYNGFAGVTNFSAPANGGCAAGSVELGPVSITAPAFQNYESFVQTVDFNISSTDQVRARYVFNKLDEIDTNAALSTFYAIEPFRYHLFTLGEYHSFGPTLLNEFRLGFNRYANTVPAGNFKYPGLDAFPNITFNDLGSGLNVGPDPNGPQFTIQNLYSANDNISWNKGRHDLKFGVEFHEYISPQQFTQRKRGDYTYNTTELFMEDFSPDNFGERSSGSVTYYGNQSAIYWYANDTWRVRPNLSLNAGLRYEFTTLPKSESQQTLNAISDDPNIMVSAVNEPLLFKKPQVPKDNWAPRVGIAYSPGKSGNTSIRAGFGMAYDVLYDNIGTLAVPPQIGATNDVVPTTQTAGFFAGGALSGGGSGITTYDQATARNLTSNWIPSQLKWPYSLNWNLGMQHSFNKNYTAEVRYVGTRGVHLDVQDRINKQALVNSQNFLPTYLTPPTQAELDALTTVLCHPDASGTSCVSGLESGSELIPAYANDGFVRNIVADLPLGSSSYHGLQSQLTRRFSNGLTFQVAYTWSHTIDNSTADFHSTDLTPRRPQDFQNWAAEKSTSALSRAHRFTVAMVYDLPYFKGGNWFEKNILGNWLFSPVYTYESPELVTIQSTQDSNLNGDAAGDRAILNRSGIHGQGGDVLPLTNTAGDVVAYQALMADGATPCGSPQQCPQFIRAGIGALSDIGRNTLPSRPTNNFDLGVYKDVGVTERVKFRFGAQFANVFNHPQYIPGIYPGQGLGVNDVNSFNTFGANYQSYLTPGTANFNVPKSVFASAARTIALVGKITF